MQFDDRKEWRMQPHDVPQMSMGMVLDLLRWVSERNGPPMVYALP